MLMIVYVIYLENMTTPPWWRESHGILLFIIIIIIKFGVVIYNN